jgi:dienelactone hydrolase
MTLASLFRPSKRKELVMPNPTIVLVHGAFGDASSWRPVYDRLVADGYTVLAPKAPSSSSAIRTAAP